jgi:hypothetical protein
VVVSSSILATPLTRFVLRNREIERFEDKHRGIFELWEGFFGRGTKPNSREIKDLLALLLVGGGMKDVDADLVIAKGTPADLLRFFQIAQAVLGVAFMPDVTEAADVKKNTVGQPQSD